MEREFVLVVLAKARFMTGICSILGREKRWNARLAREAATAMFVGEPAKKNSTSTQTRTGLFDEVSSVSHQRGQFFSFKNWEEVGR